MTVRTNDAGAREDLGLYGGTWRMLVIGPGPGPKNVLAERVEDGAKLVVAYATWKHRMAKDSRASETGMYTTNDDEIGRSHMDVQVQIMQVQVRNTRTGRSVYDVACSDGQKRSCWDPNIATALNSYAGTGQTVTLRVDVKPSRNGQYMNHDITAFAPPGGQLPPDVNGMAAPMGQPMQAPMGGAQPLPMGGNTQPIQTAPQGGGSYGGGRYTPEVTARITKLASYEYAATLVGGLFAGSGPEAEQQATEMLDRIARHIYSAARSHEHADQAQQGQIQPVATTPQGVADFANGQVAGAVQVGAPVEGAGVAQAQDASAEAPDVIQWD